MDNDERSMTDAELNELIDFTLGRRDGSDDAVLAEMNEKYAVVQIGGKTRVMGFEADPAYPGCKVPVFKGVSSQA
jgi:hypothetical protein